MDIENEIITKNIANDEKIIDFLQKLVINS